MRMSILPNVTFHNRQYRILELVQYISSEKFVKVSVGPVMGLVSDSNK